MKASLIITTLLTYAIAAKPRRRFIIKVRPEASPNVLLEWLAESCHERARLSAYGSPPPMIDHVIDFGPSFRGFLGTFDDDFIDDILQRKGPAIEYIYPDVPLELESWYSHDYAPRRPSATGHDVAVQDRPPSWGKCV